MPLGTEVGLGPGDIVLDLHLTQCRLDRGLPPYPDLPLKGAQPPYFSTRVYFGRTTEWINVLLSTKVDLGPGHIVLDWDPVPPKNGGTALHFGTCLLWPNGCPSQLLLSTCSDLRMWPRQCENEPPRQKI